MISVFDALNLFMHAASCSPWSDISTSAVTQESITIRHSSVNIVTVHSLSELAHTADAQLFCTRQSERLTQPVHSRTKSPFAIMPVMAELQVCCLCVILFWDQLLFRRDTSDEGRHSVFNCVETLP